MSEFNEFKPRLKPSKNRFQLSAGLNLEKLKSIIIIFKTVFFSCGFTLKVDCAFLLQEQIFEFSQLNTFKPRKTTISCTLNKGFKGTVVNQVFAIFACTVT